MSSHENMAILTRGDGIAYGQDYRILEVHKYLNIKLLSARETHFEEINNYQTIIIFDTDDLAIQKIVNGLKCKNIISHFQLNLSYLNEAKRNRSIEVLKKSKVIIVPSMHLKDDLEANISNNIIVIKNGVDLNNFTFSNSQNHPIKFGYVGRFSKSKGLQILQFLWNNLKKKYTLQFDSVNNLFKIATECRILSNFSLVRELHPTPSFDCLIFPSLNEVAPMVVIESLMSGVPVISTNSSPFLKELQAEIGIEYLKLIELPNYLRDMPREQLSLNEIDTLNIAKQFMQYMKNFKPLTLPEKKVLSEKMIQFKYTSQDMANSFSDVYLRYL